MTSSAKDQKNKDLQLETDLLLSSKDVAFMRKTNPQDGQDLESYLDLLEEINAFESKKIKTEFYQEEFEL